MQGIHSQIGYFKTELLKSVKKITLFFFRPHVVRMTLACHSYVTRMYEYIIGMSLVCTLMSSVRHSNVPVCHPYVTRMYSYVIRTSLVCTRISSVCYSYVLVCHLYNTRMYSYVIRRSLVCTRMYSHVIRM